MKKKRKQQNIKCSCWVFPKGLKCLHIDYVGGGGTGGVKKNKKKSKKEDKKLIWSLPEDDNKDFYYINSYHEINTGNRAMFNDDDDCLLLELKNKSLCIEKEPLKQEQAFNQLRLKWLQYKEQHAEQYKDIYDKKYYHLVYVKEENAFYSRTYSGHYMLEGFVFPYASMGEDFYIANKHLFEKAFNLYDTHLTD